MDISSDENSDFSESEMEDRVEKVYSKLKDGGLFKKNQDGSLRCPFCLGKKKQDYKYKDLLQHANGVGNSRKRMKEAVNHLALERFLRNDLDQPGSSPLPTVGSRPAKRVRLERKEDKFVWPWMAIVTNVPPIMEGGVYPTNGKLKAHFAEFSPAKVTLMWDGRGFRGMAVVEFDRDWAGFYSAISFEKSFEVNHHGKLQWAESKGRDPSMHAWLAREDDYHTSDSCLKEQLHHGNLKTIFELQHEEERKRNTLVDDLTLKIDEKNKNLESSVVQLMEVTYSLNQFKTELEKKDSQMAQLIEEVKKAENRNVDLRTEILKEREKWCQDLATEMSQLAQQRLELQEREAQNDYEKKKLEEDKKKFAARDISLQTASVEQKKAEESFLKLMEDHKREKDMELKRFCEIENRLQTKQTLELEIEKLRGNLRVMKVLEGDDDMDTKIGVMKDELEEKQSELDHLESNYQALIIQQRRANDELQEARKEAISGLKILTANKTDIGIKRMGEINTKAFKETYMTEMEALELLSKWEECMRDPNWFPFKVIQDGCNAKEIIDENDEKLIALRMERGPKIYEAIVTAMKELNEYNPSGRYIVEEMWNFKENRRASLKEVIAHLIKLLKTRKK